MLGKIYKELLIVVGVFVLVWLGFTALKWTPNSIDLDISIEQEEQLGEVLAEAMQLDENNIHDPFIDSTLYVITQRLSQGMTLTDYEYHFHIVKSDRVNAFATLGGHIYILSGLIEVMESPEELAAVLAHEIGHVEHRHIASKITKDLGLTLLFSILTGGDPVLVQEILEITVSSVFDREHEREADDYGLDLLENSGISPRNMASSFRKLKEQSNGYNVPEIVSSHPNINSRIQKSLNFEMADGFVQVPILIDWNNFQEAVKNAN